ncbi:2-C-methyl-D-erythritol 4-phosphate cytidylyltransferase [candidate division WOR-1 bacterium RIFOXYB2_FULL_48_7]|uniref:2-C-methyl-D-erythritol 4-phosphate cytidylyltransferase n=1 Tax=candidate division WOR-1 bacterium RIFOXYB2_FULL_48_7 TaxID=1802583 RepID=A0A1F4T9Q4_UNCSA|nr:MAG: 2-C-methyl-D-erythritol 4-phosphate cytidylyltransferase [candidate division WOR-1 bacterium RIFOXYB2_FULL_48_7]
MKNIAIIVAGGKGKRMGQPKQFLPIKGRPMLAWTVAAFDRAKIINGIILVVSKEQLRQAMKIKSPKILAVTVGGEERFDSVSNGLALLPPSAQFVVIHDGARPAITPEIISRSITEAKKTGAAVVGVPVKDTVKRVATFDAHVIQETLDRSVLWQAQTPQTFLVKIIRQAYAQMASGNKRHVTDDSILVEKLGIKVKMVMGSYFNLKVTTPEDLAIMSVILGRRSK